MSLHRVAPNRSLARHRDAVEFGLTYLVLATFPVLDLILPGFAANADRLAPDWIPGGVFLSRPWFWVVLAMFAVGVGYAAVRRLRVPLGLPGRDGLDAVGVTAVAPLLIAAGYFLATHALGTSVAAVGSIAAIPNPDPGFFWWNAVLPGVLVGLGYGVLFYGAILGGFREAFDPVEALLAVVTLAWLYHWFVDPVWRLARSNVLLTVALVFVVGTTFAVVELSRTDSDGTLRGALTPTRTVAIALAAFLAFTVAVDVLSGATTPGDLLLTAAWLAVFAVAARVRERARSIWPPTLTIALFQIALLALPSLEVTAGLVAVGA